METAEEEPADGNMPMEAPPDNMSVADDGSIRITTPDGETMVYTPNEDGSYNIPTKTESGLKIVDSDRNEIEPGQTMSAEDVQSTAQWFKDHEEEQRAERAAEDARQQEERDRLASENAAWQAEQSRINNQKSWLTKELEEEKEWKEKNYDRLQHVEKMRDKYAQGDKSLSEDELKRVMKKTQLKKNQAIHMREGGEYEQEAAEWDNKVIAAEGTKFVVDQTVNAYGMLTHDPVLPRVYNAATNYTETLTDAYVNNKSMTKAFVKATVDTTIDLVVDKGENFGFKAAVASNTVGSGLKRVNDNLYNGRKLTDGVGGSLLQGSLTGLVSGGASTLIKVTKDTPLDIELGGPDHSKIWNLSNLFGSTPDPKIKGGSMDADVPTGKMNTDVETGVSKPRTTTDMDSGAPKPRTTADADNAVPKTRTDADNSATKTRTDADNTSSKTRTDTDNTTSKTRTDTDNTTSKTRTDTDNTTSKTRTDADNTTSKTRTDADNTSSKTRTDADNTSSKTRTDTDNTTSKTRTDTDNTTSKTRTDADNTSSKTRTDTDNTASKSRTDTENTTSKSRTDTENTSSKTRTDTENTSSKTRTDTENTTSKSRTDTENTTSKSRTDTDNTTSKSRTDTDNTASKSRTDTDNTTSKTRTDADNTSSKTRTDADNTSSKTRTDTDNTTSKTRTDTDNATSKTRTDADNATSKTRTDADNSSSKPKTGGAESKKTSIAERRLGKGTSKTNQSEADIKQQLSEELQGQRAMNEVRKLHKISEKMASMEKANPKGYQNDPEYQKLSEQFDSQARTVRENKLSIQRMNLLQGKTGTDLRSRYNKSDIAYEQEVLRERNKSLAEEYGLSPDQIGDFNVTSKRIEDKLAGGMAGNDTDTSPNVKVLSAGENDPIKTVDFTQVDGDHHLARAIYKVEHGRYPKTAAEYDEALRLKQTRDFTNVSVRPTDTHQYRHNPDAYMGSSKGDVNKVLHPEINGTPEKGTGVYNEMTAINKQGKPLKLHHEQYAEAQRLKKQLDTDTTLSEAERTDLGKRIKNLKKESANNHFESVRTTAKEFNVIEKINQDNIKKGLKDGLSKEARQIGEWANKVARGEMDPGEYKSRVEEAFGSEENALRIVARGFRDTNL